LMYISFGQSTIDKILSINFINLVPIGLMIALLTGLGSLLFNKQFLTHTFGNVNLLLFDEFELATTMIFLIGVLLSFICTYSNITYSMKYKNDNYFNYL